MICKGGLSILKARCLYLKACAIVLFLNEQIGDGFGDGIIPYKFS